MTSGRVCKLTGRTVCVTLGCNRAPDPKSRKGYCYDCRKAARRVWAAGVAQLCAARDQRHEEYRKALELIDATLRAVGVRELAVTPCNTGFAYWLEKHGGAGKRGVVRVTDGNDSSLNVGF